MLFLHRSSRGDLLVERLAEILAVPLDDPFTGEVVAVPTRGVERWLTQQLSLALGSSPVGSAGPGGSGLPPRHDGVCANIEFPFPAALVGSALAATGLQPDADPWRADRAVWPLLDAVEDAIREPWMRTLARHLGRDCEEIQDDAHRARRWSTVRHLADLYDRYGVHRPTLIQAWADGRDVDASGAPLPDDLAWQAPLWRRLRERIGVPSPPERLEQACAVLRDEPDRVDLPERISLFGLTRLSASYLAVLDAVAARRDVHLWLLHPSEAHWSRTAAGLTGRPALGPRRHQVEAHRSGHPLLVTWGRDAREMQTVLAASLGRPSGTTAELRETDEAIPVAHHPPTLLGRVQADIRADRRPILAHERAGGPDDRILLAPDDRSIQVHACHGRTRQVEVLREVVLGLLADDPTLEPRDVVVMCPDIDAFAPLIQATFGPGQEATGRDLRVRLADRSLRQTNPILTTLAQLLDLAAGRITASGVVDFAGSGPVRKRFHFDDDDLGRLERWTRTAGVRWGLDPADRAAFQLQSVAAGTWASGLDRLLLGVAMSEDDLRRFGGVLPVDDVAAAEVDRLGRLAELVDRLAEAVEALRTDHRLDEWLELLAAVTDGLATTGPAEAWQRAELQTLLSDLADAALSGEEATGEEATGEKGTAESGTGGDGADRPSLSLAEIRSLLAHRLEGRPTRANFRTGHLTMCTLVPMRSVPHRVVCLLGLDDGAFPRHPSVDGDDLLARDPWVGDRDPRSEDRQLLLDALLAAREHLVITYAGRSERTNALRPPCVPVGELLDVVDAAARTGSGRPARAEVVVDHPLQRWDRRNFTPSADGRRPVSFDAVALEGARAAAGPRTPVGTLRTARLPLERADEVELDDLVRFVQHPIRAFLQQRLGIRLPEEGHAPADGLPVHLDPLDRWQIGERLLLARMAGTDLATCRAAELARGELPPGRLGETVLEPVLRQVEALVAEAGWAGAVPAGTDIAVDLDGRSLTGTVTGIHGDELSTVTFSRLAPKHRLAAWIRLLALSASCPERPWVARCLGRGERRSIAIRRLGPLGPDPSSREEAARLQLARLLDLLDRGRAEPLPMFCRTSEAWAAATGRGRPADAARAAWVTSPRSSVPGEDDDRGHVLVFGRREPFDTLLAEPARDDEQGAGWAEGEPTRLGRLALRLWEPLLAEEDR